MKKGETDQKKLELEKLMAALPGHNLDLEVVKDALLNNESIVILIADDDGNYLYVNEAATQLFGYSEKEFMLMNLRDIQVADGRNSIKLYKQFVNQGALAGVFYFYDKNDALKVGLYRARRIADDLNLSIMFDVTAQFKAFDEIIERFDDQSDVLGNLPSISFRYNHRQNGDSRFTYVSDNVWKLLRLNKRKLKGEWAIGELVLDEDLPHFIEASNKAIEFATPLVHRARLLLGDGTVSEFEVRSFPERRKEELVFYGTLYLL